jgi:hypothetical protein
MFSRFLAVSALSLALVGGAQYCRSRPAGAAGKAMISEEELFAQSDYDHERRQELCELRSRRYAFVHFLNRLSAELGRGEVALAEATERIFYFCLQNYPEHLENVNHAEEGRNIKTKIARSLLRGFDIADKTTGTANDKATLARLEQEIRALTYEEESAGLIDRQ